MYSGNLRQLYSSSSIFWQAQALFSSEAAASEIGKRIRELEKGLVLLGMIVDAKVKLNHSSFVYRKTVIFNFQALGITHAGRGNFVSLGKIQEGKFIFEV